MGGRLQAGRPTLLARWCWFALWPCPALAPPRRRECAGDGLCLRVVFALPAPAYGPISLKHSQPFFPPPTQQLCLPPGPSSKIRPILQPCCPAGPACLGGGSGRHAGGAGRSEGPRGLGRDGHDVGAASLYLYGSTGARQARQVCAVRLAGNVACSASRRSADGASEAGSLPGPLRPVWPV